MEDATVKPTVEEELVKFKAIVRHITRHEANHQQGDWFKVASRSELRRLASLCIFAHQVAVVAYCKVSDEERETIIDSLLTQSGELSQKHEGLQRDAENQRRNLRGVSA